MAELWFYETVSMTGRWSPNTSPTRPATCRVGGHLRENRSEGVGPRIRNIVQLPEDLQTKPIAELRDMLVGSDGTIAVEVVR
ncbi:MAG: hypothetical protein LCH61_12030 [Proteobacteria bacterium]|nr:hypothetical protein [Pseudomonadota bacterium]